MVSKIVKSMVINKWEVNQHDFTMSLLQLCYHKKVLMKEQIEKIEAELMILVSERIRTYTSNESSSVPTEIANRLLKSILYAIDYSLQNKSIDEAVDLLKVKTMKDIMLEGQTLIQLDLKLIHDLLGVVKETKCKFSTNAYFETINAIADHFIVRYDYKFDANNSIVMIDYPLLKDDRKETGVIYIKHYLERLYLENIYCGYFSEEEIILLLKNYGASYGLDEKELLNNVTEMILKNELAKLMMGSDELGLSISVEDSVELANKLKDFSLEELNNELMKVMELAFEKNDRNKEVKEYLSLSLNDIAVELYSSIKNHTISNYLTISRKFDDEEIGIEYISGTKLIDDDLRKLIKELQDTSSIVDKWSKIQKSISSMEDMVDIFEAEFLDVKDYLYIFSQLDDIERNMLWTQCTLDLGYESKDEIFHQRDVIETNHMWQQILLEYI